MQTPSPNGYFVGGQRSAHTFDVSMLSATATATGTGAAIELGDLATLRLDLTVSAASGTTPSLTVSIETSKDGSTWRSLGSFVAATTTTSERKSFVGCDRYARVSYTISGTTPSFTFSVKGEAL